jgi:predicted permease
VALVIATLTFGRSPTVTTGVVVEMLQVKEVSVANAVSAAEMIATTTGNVFIMVLGFRFLAERLGSGDGERRTLLSRQIACEPLPASVLFGLVVSVWLIVGKWCSS